MLRTAPPETIERAHQEAFARLTPEQRRLALQQLAKAIPPEEQRYASDDPSTLARLATRAEIRQPGILQRVFGASGWGGGGLFGRGGGFFSGGVGLGGMFAGSMLGSIAGTVIGSAIATEFFEHHGSPFGGGSGLNESYGPDDTVTFGDTGEPSDTSDLGEISGFDDLDGGDLGDL